MIRPARFPIAWTSLAMAACLGLIGCAEQAGNDVETTPAEVIEPEVPGGDVAAEPAGEVIVEEETVVEEAPAPGTVAPEPAPAEPGTEADTAPEPEPAPAPEPGTEADTAEADAIELPAVTYDELRERIAANDAKLTLVDCWASWCDPCKENFPHVIEMAEAYSDQGLKVIALSFDAGTEVEDIDQAQIAGAKEFLAGHDVSKVENLRHGQLLGESFEAFNITTIPAVFLYDENGEEVARFTYDDPDNQFTYDEVEARVAELLGVEPKGVVEAESAE